MCLDKVINTTEEPEAEGVGYKVVCKYPAGYRPITYEGNRHTEPFQLDEEVTANQIAIRIRADCGGFYQPGFHIFTTLTDAIDFFPNKVNQCIVEVKWRHKLAKGEQYGLPCIVTKYQTITREVTPKEIEEARMLLQQQENNLLA